MDLVGDERAQSIQIGAVLLFGVLIIAFSSYQAFVVPDQNRQIEFNHNQEVHSQMQDLRNAIVSVPGGTNTRAVSIQLGTRYPSRAIARNPGPPSGMLRTAGTTDESVDLTITNAEANGETGDFWDEPQSYNTGGINYTPVYNLYTQAPQTVYENTILYNTFRTGNITLANQSFVDGNEISLVMVNGSLSRSSSGSTSVDVRSVSSSTQQVQLEDNGSPIEITFASSRSEEHWDFLETTQSNVDTVTSTSIGNGLYDVTVTLATDQAYQFQLTKVGVGTRVTPENTAYITDTDGDGQNIPQGETTELTLEVRDRYNNSPDNASETIVEAAVDGSGTLESTSETPDADGEVTFVYQAPTGTTGTETIQFSYVGIDGDFDATTPQNASMTVDVTSSGGGGSSAYTVAWQNPESDNDISYLSDCSASACTWDAGSDPDSTLTLRAGTSPTVEGLDVDFGYDDSSVATVSPGTATTDASGEVTTELDPNDNGDVNVYAASGGANDAITITVENVGGNNPSAIQFTDFQGFNADAVNDEFTLEDVLVEDADGDDDLDRIEYVVTDSDGNQVATLTVNDIGPATYEPPGSPAVTIIGDPVQEGETYTLTAKAYDTDGNFDTESLSDTTDSYTINSVSASSAGTGNNIDVTFDISTSDGGAEVRVESLDNSGRVLGSTQVPVADTQPQTETIDGDNQAVEIRVILYDSSDTERDRDTIPYP